MDRFLYDRDFSHERVNKDGKILSTVYELKNFKYTGKMLANIVRWSQVVINSRPVHVEKTKMIFRIYQFREVTDEATEAAIRRCSSK